MTGIDEMQFPRRSPRLEWNLNTILNPLTLVGILAGGGVYLGQYDARDIEDLTKSRLSHEDDHKERLAETGHERPASTNVFAPRRFRG
ncbi:hypothetical protein [Neorhizobium sp. T25_13]|uniref:hypothetical protein n=1 Tax=Neorhizobium sp. T25_13 TaxID=2093830 RepID=UPI000CFA70B8|nr:hypothetical protein [Neorhizobium sp. T25_13]